MAARLAANPEMDLPTVRGMLEEVHVRTAEPTGVTYEEIDAPAGCRRSGAVPRAPRRTG
jgi:epsilon-lactone hydrolase